MCSVPASPRVCFALAEASNRRSARSVSRLTSGATLLIAALAFSATGWAAGASEPVAATPVFLPAADKYHKPQMVKITDATAGATIYYALHGTTPTTKSAKYTEPIKVGQTETIRAIAVANGFANSAIAEAKYTIDLLPAAKPVFSPSGGDYRSGLKVKITDASPGAVIYYTTGGAIPTEKSPRYTTEIEIGVGKTTLRAIAAGADLKPSEVASATYLVTPTLPKPVFDPPGSEYAAAQHVRIKDATPGATFYYTTDGTTPTERSTKYTDPIDVPAAPFAQILKAIAVKPDYHQSAVATATYTITPLVATPTFYPLPGTYSSPVAITLSDSTENAVIYYTTNGSMPTMASKKYDGTPINVTKKETINAIALAGQNKQSAVATATYKIVEGTAAPPIVSTSPAQNGAVIASLRSNSAGATIYYTLDGTAPTTSSPVYEAPILIDSELALSAIAVVPGLAKSPVTYQSFSISVPAGTLAWSDEFSNSTGQKAQPNPLTWTYDTGNGGFGNQELEDYCAWGSNVSPCSPADPNAYVGTDGYLHIVARQASPGVYTSARLKSEGLFSFQYGRLEFRAMAPEAQGFWPAGWLLGNSIATVNWPACGEQDVLERVDTATSPDWNQGSIHGTGFTGSNLGTRYDFPDGQTAAQWHTYGMIWKKGQVSYYVDDPTKPYVTYTPADLDQFAGSAWPFDNGANFIILNLAVGGSWPGSPDASTPFPSEYVIDYVRIYAN
jgi:beta-glucanase (GH16 family)